MLIFIIIINIKNKFNDNGKKEMSLVWRQASSVKYWTIEFGQCNRKCSLVSITYVT